MTTMFLDNLFDPPAKAYVGPCGTCGKTFEQGVVDGMHRTDWIIEKLDKSDPCPGTNKDYRSCPYYIGVSIVLDNLVNPNKKEMRS